ncbi:MAG: hypothetical protein P9L94_03040 [Candidatus Hinthialibacter antarcticus]|nr:hypothetical protein [Candidatus Hinthialibacter antarcticus]
MKVVSVLALSILLFAAVNSWAQNRAGILIQNSTGETISRCVEFEDAFLTVEDLLERSGFQLATQSSEFGSYVCYLHDDGAANCDAHPDGWFWNFFVSEDGAWVSAPVGISSATAQDGSIFGFAFGAWGEVELPESSFEALCEYENQAGLVINHLDGSRTVRVVDFYGETLTGFQLLQQSGLDLVAAHYSFGSAVCAIDGEGHPSDNCFGDFSASDPTWALHDLNANDEWVSSAVGVGDRLVYGGQVQGWLFGQWGDSPQPITHEEVFNSQSSVAGWSLLR